jgi:hypothetical protein
MSGECTLKHPLQHGGTGRSSRTTRSLDPDYVKLDERSKTDYLLFLQKFSKYISYYDTSNKPNGNWQPFLSRMIYSDCADRLAKP